MRLERNDREMKRVFSIIVTVIILALSITPAFADVPSPLPSIDYKIRVHNTKGGTGTYTTKKDKDGKHATITAHPKNGYKFDHWVIEGKYDLEKGDLQNPELTILMKSDIEATPYFTPEKGKQSDTPSKISYDDGPESPKTGGSPYAPLLLLGVFVILIAGAGVKLAASKK